MNKLLSMNNADLIHLLENPSELVKKLCDLSINLRLVFILFLQVKDVAALVKVAMVKVAAGSVPPPQPAKESLVPPMLAAAPPDLEPGQKVAAGGVPPPQQGRRLVVVGPMVCV
jgi:hypothetical protein